MRKPEWDYGNDGAYFITICTKDRKKSFGKVGNGVMERSEIGDLVQKFWAEIPGHFPFVELGEFVVMPDHFHGIIVINNNSRKPVETPNLGVSTVVDKKEENRKPGTIGVMINQFKRICTIHARKIDPNFSWQSRYYDHIIRDDIAFNRISEYIRKNPEKLGSS
ncbi:transposase [Salinimicrobium xinjiangense]|uniref:transposase n=1 Tax=Salinimicrobium xinjiangense TaxID=438596 RepID=UPI001B7FC218|nr:transposase [Salinimicrobium xinjiangense]